MKAKIKEYIENQGLNKTEFYRKTRLPNGFLDKDLGMSLKSLVKILKEYPDLAQILLPDVFVSDAKRNNASSSFESIKIKGEIEKLNNELLDIYRSKNLISDRFIEVIQELMETKEKLRELENRINKN